MRTMKQKFDELERIKRTNKNLDKAIASLKSAIETLESLTEKREEATKTKRGE